MKEDMGEEGTEIEEGSKKMAREGKKRRRCRKRGQRADRWRGVPVCTCPGLMNVFSLLEDVHRTTNWNLENKVLTLMYREKALPLVTFPSNVASCEFTVLRSVM